MASTAANGKSTSPGTKDLPEESSADTQVFSSLKKRKADDVDRLDGGDGDDADKDEEAEEEMGEYVDEGDDEESSLCRWSMWQVEKFANFEYNPSDDGWVVGLADREKWLRYKRQICESEGFLVEVENIPDDFSGGVFPLGLDREFDSYSTVHDMAKEVATVALDRYNQEKGTDVKFDSVVRMNYRCFLGVYCYITFMARESAGGDPVEYQAKFFHDVGYEYYPIFCRPAPNKPRGMILINVALPASPLSLGFDRVYD